ncbi:MULTISPECIES: MBL fold metallo-hydrolase [Empedobacter]|uniref:MBL fold metallo-hydrolase n=1 Tax=Empedobacter falsenii TaxID=343874 RepID=A0A427BKA1_9FLAO|nr:MULTISPECIES: MBL fold metallo-hydrolase [Empedobacter]MBY0066629.1 MBL fold metallo-hydrolase [Empedobacter falsenii]MDH1603033.1 MBL fold metallo-hydrolase [Empedobacter sp. GD03739]RRT89808.1 MBL fold metallo-hydrolase [Empedobacter falsenii]RRT89871.1 MBL fold metallo-hydrolase [Empedobacter falsenii]
MKIEQIYTGCLAQGAYYIESNGEVAIIDPLREIQSYIDQATKDNAKIKYIFETHFHADFVSGHVDLAQKTGATIVYGPTAETNFDAHIASDGEVFTLGNITITVLHTPGHTMESTTYLLKDENGKDYALFTGDTLFIGDVGRPDLAQKLNTDLTQEKLAGYLFDSLRTKIMPLANDIIVYPAHGAGSACGKNMSKETFDTLGNQKEVNYALNPNMTKEEFIVELTSGLLPPPFYFPENVMMNKLGVESLDVVKERANKALFPDEFMQVAEDTNALILDVRDPQTFAAGFIPNSINIGIRGNFAPWVGTLITDIKQPILLIAEIGEEEEAVTRLARVGYDNVIGFLNNGFQAWAEAEKDFDEIVSVSPEEFVELVDETELKILDVRKPGEYETSHVEGAITAPLDFINESMKLIDPEETYLVHCAGGYRSMIFTSILRARGYENLIDVAGGFGKIKEVEGVKIVEGASPCQSGNNSCSTK